jgi:DNA-binding Lrp family transcriptional regulator
MKLTRRQEEFISKLMDLYREYKGPIHYSMLAERLGVSPFTAYDMLRLLEEKGLVTSEYLLAPDKSGPGRTVRVFLPSAELLETAIHLGVQNTDWETFKRRILAKIHKGEIKNPDLAEEFLARVPPDKPQSLQYCIEVLSVIILRLRRIPGRQDLVKYLSTCLSQPDASSLSNLCLIAGLAFGALAEEKAAEPEWVNELLDHMGRFHLVIQRLDENQRQNLVENICERFSPVV